MTAKLARISLSVIAGMFGLALVMSMLAGPGPAAAMEDVGESGGALLATAPTDVLVDASPGEIRADGSSTSIITARVYASGPPLQGAFVAFTTTLGTIDQYCYVEAEDASVNKSPGDWVTESYVGASGGQYARTCGTAHPLGSLNWTFAASAISMLYVKNYNGGVAEVQVDGSIAITVDMYAATPTIAERVITAGLGSGSHIVTVRYLDASPVGGGTCIRIDAFRCGTTTDSTGKATATLTSAVSSCGSEDVTVTALSGGPSISYMITGTESVRFTASAPNSAVVSAAPSQIAADGTSMSFLEATVKDQFGEYVPDCTMVGFLATDENGAPPGGAWVTLPYELVEGEDPAEVIADGWSIDLDARHHGGEEIYTNTTGATASWTFTGTVVSLIHPKMPDSGVALVSVDGGAPIAIDMYASPPEFQVEHVIADGLTFGAHVIEVTVAGYTVAGGTGTYVDIDAFRSGTCTSGGVATTGLIAGTKAGVVTVEATGVGRQCCETDSVVTDTLAVTLTAGNPYTLTITPADIDTTCCVTSTLQFTVTDRYGNVVGAVVPRALTVDFTSTPQGDFSSSNVAITNGVGSVQFHGYEAGVGVITGTVRGYGATGTSNLTVTVASCDTLVVGADRSWVYVTDTLPYVLTDFVYTTTITAELADRCENRVQGSTALTFTTSLGNFSPASPIATVNGIATATLASVPLAAGVPTQTAYITVTSAACHVSGTTSVDFGLHVYTLTVSATPAAIAVGGNTSTLIADVDDGFGDPAPNGVEVGFAITPTDTATVPSAHVATAGGTATAAATSGTRAGVATIEAFVGGSITNTGLITIVAGNPYSLTIAPTDIDTTCCVTSTLQFTVTDRYNNLVGAVDHRSTAVCFYSILGDLVDNWSPGSCVVITDGVGSVDFHGWESGSGSIVGYVQEHPQVLDTSSVTVAASSPASLALSRSPIAILADGLDTTVITATVRDSCHNLVPGAMVTFTTDLGSFGPPPTTTLTITRITNASGVVTATMRSECIARRVNITATVDSLTEATYVDMVGVAWGVQLLANPVSIQVGGYTSGLTATVEDQFGHAVLDGTVVTFTTSLGSVGSDTVTKLTTNGVATAVLTSSNATGTAIITATAGVGFDTATVTFEAGPPYTVTLEAYPKTLTVGSSSVLTATVTDQYNNSVANGTVVTFTTSLGDVGSTKVTKATASGVATATLTSLVDGTAMVTATAGSGSDTADVVFQPGLPYTLTLAAHPMTLTVGSSSVLTAAVTDRYSNSVANGTVVTFTTSLGDVGSTEVTKTTASGIATATLTSLLPGMATITGTAGSVSDTVDVTFVVGPPYTVTLGANPTSILVGGFTSTLAVTVVDQYHNNVTDGTSVLFETSLGSLGSLTVTKLTASGVATATLTSGNMAGSAMVTATTGSEVATTVVTFTPDIPGAITLMADPTSLTVVETSTLAATVKDRYNNNVADGTSVLFETSLGSLGSITITRQTANGVAITELTSQAPGTATITATAGPVSDTIDVTFEVGPPYTVTLVADPGSLTVGGASVLTATVTDQYSNSVADGTVVTLTTSLGDVGSNWVTKTTASGVATATLTSQVAGTAVVTATSGSKYGTANVIFNPDLPDMIMVEADPTSIPIGGFASEVTATVRDQYDNLVADGTEVTFVTDLGSIASNSVAKTTVNGVANATLISGLIIGTANVTATSGSAEGHTGVVFTVGAAETVTVESWPPTIEVGGSVAVITATVRDMGGYLVADGTPVVFTTDFAVLGSNTVTKHTASGVATATLTSGTVVGVAHITATSNSKSGTTTVEVAAGPPFDVQVATDLAYIPIGGATTQVTATVKDRYGNNVINGTNVDFITSLGNVSPSSATTYEGAAVTYLTSGVIKGVAEVTAISGSADGSVDVIFTVGPPFYINVVANPTSIGLGGQTSDIQATVKDIAGDNVADGTEITFITSFGLLGSDMVTKTTTSGVATATLTSETTAGTAVITATANSHYHTVTVVFNPDPPQNMTVTADPMAISANGVSKSVIRATVTDQYGNMAADGVGCSFHTNLGTIWPLFSTTLNGVAETTLTSSETSGVALVVATCDGIEDTVNVFFYVYAFRIYLPVMFRAY